MEAVLNHKKMEAGGWTDTPVSFSLFGTTVSQVPSEIEPQLPTLRATQ